MDASDDRELNSDENQDDGLVDSQESAVDSSDSRQEKISPRSYGLLALFFGWLGIHDFSAGRHDYGCIHFIMTVIALCVFPFNVSSFLPPTLLFASWLWAIWETIQYRKTSNVVHARTQEVDKRDYVIKAKVTECFAIIAIIAVVVTTYFVGSFRNCSASGCSGAGWAIVIAIGIGFIPFTVAVVLLIGELVSHHKMPQELKKDKTLKNHAIAMCCLGFILLLVTVALIILFAMPK
ncbi:MAG: hypothetical protein Q4A70_00400 [Candidatus Saccharibacteria bacterium]|nr:hypothetical protein [Candidatus Saccharibacteria bacterium]